MNNLVNWWQIEKLNIIISNIYDTGCSQDKELLWVGVYESGLCVEVTWVGPRRLLYNGSMGTNMAEGNLGKTKVSSWACQVMKEIPKFT